MKTHASRWEVVSRGPKSQARQRRPRLDICFKQALLLALSESPPHQTQ
jgi:hypothetical protein